MGDNGQVGSVVGDGRSWSVAVEGGSEVEGLLRDVMSAEVHGVDQEVGRVVKSDLLWTICSAYVANVKDVVSKEGVAQGYGVRGGRAVLGGGGCSGAGGTSVCGRRPLVIGACGSNGFKVAYTDAVDQGDHGRLGGMVEFGSKAALDVGHALGTVDHTCSDEFGGPVGPDGLLLDRGFGGAVVRDAEGGRTSVEAESLGAAVSGGNGVQFAVSGSAGVTAGCETFSSGGDKYVPPHARGVEGVVRGKHYAANKAARERQKRKKQALSESAVSRAWGSAFSACTQEQREGLQRTRALRLMAENELKTAEAELKFVRLRAEREFALKDVDSGAYVNRIQMRNEALDKKWQDQAENVQSYRRTSPVQGWVKTVVSGEGSGPSSPRSVPTLSSGESPRSESDWELEMKRRDEENAQLRKELQAMIEENDNYRGSCDDYDSRNFNQPEHYGSTKAGDDVAVPWDQDSRVVALQEMMRSRPLVVK